MNLEQKKLSQKRGDISVEITDYIVSRLEKTAVFKNHVLVGVCGRAGAGKTTLVRKISSELKKKEIKNVMYSGDWRFNLDSAERKIWLQEKWKTGMDAYLYAINQFNWWNFDLIYKDLMLLRNGSPLQISNAYNRTTGRKDLEINIPQIERGVILFENCVLGGVDNLEILDIIVLVNTPDIICHQRILKKDERRRSLPEIMIRNLITTYSENVFFKILLDNFSAKTIACDSEGFQTSYPKIEEVSHIPVPISEKTFQQRKKAAIFCDLEGIIVKHESVPSERIEDIEFIDGSLEKLKEFKEKEYFIVLTSSRPSDKVFSVVEKIRSLGLEFDQIVCDLPVGPKIQISDSKDGKPRAEVYIAETNEGIKKLEIP